METISKNCGHCAFYVRKPDNEDICAKTGRVVPFLAEKDCWCAERPEDDTNPVTMVETRPERRKKAVKPAAKRGRKKKGEEVPVNPIDAEVTKHCPRCGRDLPLTSFGNNKSAADGHQRWCRECMAAHFQTKKQVKKKAKIAASIKSSPLEDFVMDEILSKCRPAEALPLNSYADQELVDELRARGWSVDCSRTIMQTL